jgi:hypothetical protein
LIGFLVCDPGTTLVVLLLAGETLLGFLFGVAIIISLLFSYIVLNPEAE